MPRKERYNKKYGLPESAMIIPKRKLVTVNDILTRDDVYGMIDNLEKIKPHITDCIVIYMDKRDGMRYFVTTDNTAQSLATWMLETTKLDLLEE